MFLTWWFTFKWASFHNNSNDKKKTRLHWKSEKKATIWKHFCEKTTVQDKTSKIICKRCQLILEHSAVENDINTIKIHLTSKQCSEIFKIDDLSQLTLTKIWKRVSWFFINVKFTTFSWLCFFRLFVERLI
jgi:hypothetical protein